MEPMDESQIRNFYTKIRDWLNERHNEGYPEIYSPLRSDEDRIKLTLQLFAQHNIPGLRYSMEQTECLQKSRGRTQEFGRSADKLLRLSSMKSCKKDVLVELCTKAVAYAPADSEESALSYGRRAEGLFRARLYEDSLKDIGRAIVRAYPKEFLVKLKILKVKCLIALHGRKSKPVLEAIKEISDSLEWANEGIKPWAIKSLNKMKNGTFSEFDEPFEKWNDEAYLPEIEVNNNNHEEMIGASSALAIRYSGKYGRHIVATRDIEIGEVLAVQSPYAGVLEFERRYTNCWYCLKQTWSGIPCDNCAHVIYCSVGCKVKAWREFHDIECNVLGMIIIERLQACALMSIRLLVKGLKECGGWRKLREKIEEIESNSDFRTRGFTKNMLDSTKYSSVYSLTTNTEKRSMEDLFRLSVGSATITYILATMTKIFGRKFDGDIEGFMDNKWVIFAGSVILKHLQIHMINAQMLCEWDHIEGISYARAMAILPLYGLINHSCNPMVTYTSHGKYVALHSIAPIKKGEQIFDFRGIHYADTPREKRQLQRKEQFFFICDCIPCAQNWPLYNDLPSYESMNFSDSIKKKLVETMCAHNYCAAMTYHPVIEFGKVAPLSIATVVDNLKMLYKYVQEPCKEIYEVVKTLESVYNQIGSRCQSLDK